jgi:hypothetical protein
MGAPVNPVASAPEMRGTWGAFALAWIRRGVTTMVAATKTLGMVLMVVVPGGLLILSAFVLARVVAQQMRAAEGPQGRRLARAVATVRWRDVVRETRAMW